MTNLVGYVGRIVFEHHIDDRLYRVVKLRNGSLRVVVLDWSASQMIQMSGF